MAANIQRHATWIRRLTASTSIRNRRRSGPPALFHVHILPVGDTQHEGPITTNQEAKVSSATDHESTKNARVELSREMVQMEQQGEAARKYFEPHLSDQLIFCRASGKVDGRSVFLDGVTNNTFESRECADVSAIVQNDRSLITLIVVGKRKDDGSVHLYRNIRLFHAPAINGFWSVGRTTSSRLFKSEMEDCVSLDPELLDDPTKRFSDFEAC